MATGSLVSSCHGEPRASHDIDLVEVSILEAIPMKDGMFNLLDNIGGDKVDFWILKPDPFDQQCFARRHLRRIVGVDVKISQPEDTILAKLRWCEMSGFSEKQFNDVLRIYENQHARLDRGHIECWSMQLGVLHLWERTQTEADLT